MSRYDLDVASHRCLVLFTKPAVPGRVKTRLIGELSAEEEALLHAAFVDDTLERLRRAPCELRIAWAAEPGGELPEVGVPAIRQRGADLGERLFHGLAAFADEHVVRDAVQKLEIAHEYADGVRVYGLGIDHEAYQAMGKLLALYSYMWLVYGPLEWFAEVNSWMTRAFAGAECASGYDLGSTHGQPHETETCQSTNRVAKDRTFEEIPSDMQTDGQPEVARSLPCESKEVSGCQDADERGSICIRIGEMEEGEDR